MAIERFSQPSRVVPGLDIVFMRETEKDGRMVWPELKTETKLLRKGTQKEERFRPLACDMLYKKDTPVKMRDGVTIYVDLFCPTDEAAQYPVVLVWTQYGKIDPPNNYDVYENRAEMKEKLSCGYNTFEGPEPDYWVSNGYIVCVADCRGCTNSEGVMYQPGASHALDIYDTVEWLAAQPFSNGKVGMIGNSQLAHSQYFAAAAQPPHLTAIAPWEAVNDSYRDQICRGGIADGGLFDGIVHMLRVPNGIEDLNSMLKRYPTAAEDYWRIEKLPAFDKITIPMYMVASWTSNVHPYGTLRAWNRIASGEKWLRIHNTQEWPDQQTPKYRDELRRFYDHYLKGEDNGWEQTPRVRLSLLDPFGPDVVDLPVPAFPLPDTSYRRLYLDGAAQTLSETPAAAESSKTYPIPEKEPINLDYLSKRTYSEVVREGDGLTQFRFTFMEDTTLCGYFKAHLFASTSDSDDMDLYLYVSKEDSLGVADYPVVLGVNFMGAESRLRVSHRRVEDDTIYDFRYAHAEEERLKPGEIVEFDAYFWPLGMIWRRGETLVLTVSSRNLQMLEIPVPPLQTRNRGTHTIYTGGKYNTYLEIPVVDLSGCGGA